MNSSLLFIVLLSLTLFSYWFGIRRSLKVAGGAMHKKDLTCLPEQFGLLTAMVCGLPALVTLLIFNSAEQFVIEQLLTTTLPMNVQSLSSVDLGLYLNNIRSIASSETAQTLIKVIELPINIDVREQYQAALTLQTLNWLKQTQLWLSMVNVVMLVCYLI